MNVVIDPLCCVGINTGRGARYGACSVVFAS